MPTKNVGQISAIFVGTTAPSNTTLLWYDDNTGQKKFKYYDTVTLAWVELGGAKTLNQVLTSGNTTSGLDIIFSTGDAVKFAAGSGGRLVGTTTGALRTWTLPDESGSILLGAGTAGRVGYYSSTSNLTSTSNFTFDGTKLSIPVLQITTGAGANKILFSDASGNASWNSQVSVAQGGTGKSSYAVGSMIYASGTTTLSEIALGTNNQLLQLVAGVPTWSTVSVSSIYTTSDTITDNARTVTLKTGTTNTYNFSLANSAGVKGLYFNGASQVGLLTSTFTALGGGEFTNLSFGDATNGVAIGVNYRSSVEDNHREYIGTSLNLSKRGGSWSIYNMTTPNTNVDIKFNLAGNGARVHTNCFNVGTWQTGYGHYSSGIAQVTIGTSNGGKGQLRIYNDAASDYMWNLEGENGNSYSQVSFAVGTNSNSAARFTVKGVGSTPVTTTALFQNSSSSAALEIKDDRTSIFGNISTSYIKLDPYGVAAFGILQFCAAGTTTAYNAYDSTNAERFRVETSGRVIAFRGSLSSYMNYSTSINYWAEGTTSNFHLVGTNGSNHTVYLGNDSGHGYAEIKNSSGVTKSRISGNGDSYFINSLAVGGSSANASAILDIQSTTLGFGLPSMTTTQKNAISSPRAGLMVFDNVLNQASYYNGSAWVNI